VQLVKVADVDTLCANHTVSWLAGLYGIGVSEAGR
jgi:hypothetical protein